MSDCDQNILHLLYTHPRFAGVRARAGRERLYLRLRYIMAGCGEPHHLRLQRSVWKYNLCCSYARMDEALQDWQDADILYAEEDGDFITVTLSAWVRQGAGSARAGAVVEMNPPARGEFPSDDPDYRRRKREEKAAKLRREAGLEAEGGADAPPSASFEEFAESKMPPQSTPQNEIGAEIGAAAESAEIPQTPLNQLINNNLELDSNLELINQLSPRSDVWRFTRSFLVGCGIDAEKVDELIAQYGIKRAGEVCAIVSVEDKRRTGGYVIQAFQKNYPMPPLKKVPIDAQMSLGLLVPVAPKKAPADIAEAFSTPQSTPQRSGTFEPGLGASGNALRRQATEQAEIEARLARFRAALSPEEQQRLRDEAAARLKERAPQVYAMMQREISAGKAEFGTVVRGNLDRWERDILLGLMAAAEGRTGTDG